MKKMSQVLLGSILTFASAGVLADDHEMFAGDMDPAEPMSVQAQICNLNDGVSLSDYNKVTEKYKKWAKKNDAEVALFRQFPMMTHNNPNNPYPADFVEFLVTDFENAGTSWDKWMTTKTGQKLAAEWGDVGTCHIKMGRSLPSGPMLRRSIQTMIGSSPGTGALGGTGSHTMT